MPVMRLLILTAASAIALAAAGFGSARVEAASVSVTMTDFKFKLSKTSVPRGAVTFSVVNRGDTGHDFKIAGKKTPIYSAGKRGTLRVTFTKAGRYPFICAVPGHTALGMKGVLRVT